MKTLAYMSGFFLLCLAATSCDLGPTSWPVTFEPSVEVLQEGAGEEFGPELFPLNPGEKRVYYAANSYLIHQVDAASTRVNGKEVSIVKRAGITHAVDWYLRLEEKGLWDYGDMTDFYPCGFPRLLFPVRVGKRWVVKNQALGFEVLAVVKAREKIETAAGEFDALQVVYWFSGEENVLTDPEQAFWFAPGNGLVKFRITHSTFLLRYGSAP